jgi:hypothetical protein
VQQQYGDLTSKLSKQEQDAQGLVGKRQEELEKYKGDVRGALTEQASALQKSLGDRAGQLNAQRQADQAAYEAYRKNAKKVGELGMALPPEQMAQYERGRQLHEGLVKQGADYRTADPYVMQGRQAEVGDVVTAEDTQKFQSLRNLLGGDLGYDITGRPAQALDPVLSYNKDQAQRDQVKAQSDKEYAAKVQEQQAAKQRAAEKAAYEKQRDIELASKAERDAAAAKAKEADRAKNDPNLRLLAQREAEKKKRIEAAKKKK